MVIEFNPVLPVWVIALVIAGLLALLTNGCRVLVGKRVPVRWITILALIRVGIVAVLLVCLLRPVVTLRRSVSLSPEMMVLVDTSRSVGAAGSTAGNKPWLSDELVQKLGEQFNLSWYTFDDGARPVADAADALRQSATGTTTRYGASVAGAWNLLQQRTFHARGAGAMSDAPPARVLLVSDGNDHGVDDPVAVAHDLGLTVDVLPVGRRGEAGATQGVKITCVQGSLRALLGSELRFIATLNIAPSAAGAHIYLDLSEDGQPVRSYEVAQPPPRKDANVETQTSLTYRPAQAGLHRYALSVRADAPGKPAPAATAPTTQPRPDAQQVQMGVLVVNEQVEVLVLEDSWRWSFKYLRRLLEDDPNFSVTSFLARNDPTYMQFAEPGRRVSLGGFPQSRSEMAWFDTIILGDVDPSRWPPTLPTAIHELVVEDGKTLIVQAGPNLAKLMRYPAITSLLPVDLTESSAKPVLGPLPTRLTIEGSSSPLFFSADATTGTLWRDLPPLDQVYAPFRKKPGAAVLVEAAQVANEAGRLIVIAEQTVGRGRVIYVGTDTLWKWQMLGRQIQTGLTPYALFWQQALRATSPQSASAPGMKLDIQPDRGRYEVGQRVRLRATLKSDRPLQDVTMIGVLSGSAAGSPSGGDAAKQVPLVFVPDANNPGVYETGFTAPSPGIHMVQASVQAGSQTLVQAVTAIDVQPSTTEADDAAINLANLERLALSTGGRVVHPDDSATWPTSDQVDRRRVVREYTHDLWSNFTLPVLLALVFGVDWLLRLVRGYV